MKRPGIIKKLMLSILGIFICLILLFYWMFGWLWVPRYRTRFNDSRDFAYKIPMSCHDTEYDYCTDIRYVYEKYRWSKIGGYVRYVDTVEHYEEEKDGYYEKLNEKIDLYSDENIEYRKRFGKDLLWCKTDTQIIDEEFLAQHSIDSKLLGKLLLSEELNEYSLLYCYYYNYDTGEFYTTSQEDLFCVLCNDDNKSFIVIRHIKTESN